MELIATAPFANVPASRDRARVPDPAVVLPPPPGLTEEALVADARAGVTPAQMVERKLASLLKSQPLPVSHLMTARRTSRGR
jgi:hypothetical protein